MPTPVRRARRASPLHQHRLRIRRHGPALQGRRQAQSGEYLRAAQAGGRGIRAQSQ